MKFPIMNGTSKPMTVFIELEAREFSIPVGSTAVITLNDSPESYVEIRDDLLVVGTTDRGWPP